MTGEIVPTQSHDLAPLEVLGQAANRAAAAATFRRYQQRRAANTLRRQRAGLALFADYLNDKAQNLGSQATDAERLYSDPEAWRGVTWGLVEAFRAWMLGQGYSVGAANVHLSTVKTYARLAAQAGALSREEYAMIATVQGLSRKEGRHVDTERKQAGQPTRKGRKKPQPVSLSPEDIERLKALCDPDTFQGRRDLVIVTFLAGLGLRVSELAGLTLGDLEPKDRPELATVYRPKTDRTDTLRLPADARAALLDYLANAPEWLKGDDTPLLYRTRKNGKPWPGGMSTAAIAARVAYLGQKAGIPNLSPHDFRHYWATQAARAGASVDALMQGGGWASPAMPLRYVKAAEIANQGVLEATGW